MENEIKTIEQLEEENKQLKESLESKEISLEQSLEAQKRNYGWYAEEHKIVEKLTERIQIMQQIIASQGAIIGKIDAVFVNKED